MNKIILCLSLISTSVLAYEPNIIKTQVPFNTQEKTILKYNKVAASLLTGITSSALVDLEEILQENPAFVPARLKLVDLKLANKQEEEARKLLEQGLSLDNANPHLIKKLAKIKQDKGDLDGSLKELNKLPEQELLGNEYQQMLAYNYYQLGFYDLAHRHYAQLVRYDSRNSKWWLGLAITQDTVGNNKNAIISYTKAKVIGGLEPEILNYIEGRINYILTKEKNDKT